MAKDLKKEIQWLKEEKYHDQETKEFKKDLTRLKRGEHIDYAIGFTEFLDCKIDLSKKPFIPRPETEFWAEKAIDEMLGNKISYNRSSKSLRDFGICALGGLSSSCSEPCQTASEGLSENLLPARQPILCLDLFSGSGCIGVAVLKHIPQAHVDFGEKEKKFCKQIALNAKLNNIYTKRYKVIHSNVFSNIKRKYNYIFANPPYIAKIRKRRVQKSVLEQEPRQALFGGQDGLYYIKKFLKEAKKHLKPQGKIYMEFDSFQKQAIAKLLKQFNYSHFEFSKDQYGAWRFVFVRS